MVRPLGINQLSDLNDIHMELENVSYPISKGRLVRHFENIDAPPSILILLRELPEESFDSPEDVSDEIDDMDVGNFMT